MFDDDSYGKMANSDGYDTIFMEWKYWMKDFSEALGFLWRNNDDFINYL